MSISNNNNYLNQFRFQIFFVVSILFVSTVWTQTLTENFETGLPTSAPATETAYTLSSGTWLLKYAYKGTNSSYICSDGGIVDLRMLKDILGSGYAITPLLSSGVGTITFKEGRGSRTITVQKSTDNGMTWTTIGTPVSTQCITISIIVNDASVNRIKFWNASGSDEDIDNISITSSTPSSGLTVSPTSLPFGDVVINTTSVEMTYSLYGTNLIPASDSVTVTAPTGFQVSTTSGSGFSSSLKIAYGGGTLSSTLIYVRFSPSAVQSYSGNITNSGGGATTQNVAVTGTGVQNTSSNNRYVATNGSDTNPGTKTLPFKTIAKAVSVITAGDTIFIRGGTYTYSSAITISISGSPSAKYYLFAYPGERPLLDFSSESMGNKGINLTGSYWHIKGIDIKGAGDNGLYIGGAHNVIEYCVFYENRDSGLQLSGGASNNQVINCDSYFNADPTDYADADGFAVKMDVGSGNYFYGCRSWQNVDDGWDGYLRGADSVFTTIENCWTFKNGYLKDGSDPGAQANGNGFKMGGSDNKDLQHHFTLINCLSFSNKLKGFDQNNNKGSMTLYNCTGYANGGNNYSISSALAAGQVLTVKNCAELGGKVSLLSTAVQTTNSWMLSPTVTNVEFFSVDTSLYAGATVARNSDGSLPTIAFMHLSVASRLIDAGTNIGLPYNGSAPDLGAFETSGPLPIQLASFVGSFISENSVKLDWETISEVNNYGFYVEKYNSITNKFEIAENSFQSGHGTTLEPQHYSWIDGYTLSPELQYRLKQIDNNGLINYFGPIKLNPNGVKENPSVPSVFALNQNYPNPFNPATEITFTLAKSGYTTLKVYNVLGNEVKTLFNGQAEAGKLYIVHFDGSGLASGLYFYKLQNDNKSDTKKLILLK
jgi:hypothetical protein